MKSISGTTLLSIKSIYFYPSPFYIFSFPLLPKSIFDGPKLRIRSMDEMEAYLGRIVPSLEFIHEMGVEVLYSDMEILYQAWFPHSLKVEHVGS